MPLKHLLVRSEVRSLVKMLKKIKLKCMQIKYRVFINKFHKPSQLALVILIIIFRSTKLTQLISFLPKYVVKEELKGTSITSLTLIPPNLFPCPKQVLLAKLLALKASRNPNPIFNTQVSYLTRSSISMSIKPQLLIRYLSTCRMPKNNSMREEGHFPETYK